MLAGTTTDILVYSMIVPIVPFRLQHLGYDGVSGLVGWLLFAYVSRAFSRQLAIPTESLTIHSYHSPQHLSLVSFLDHPGVAHIHRSNPATPPIAYLSEKHKNRKIPLLGGQIFLIAAQVMLMEAPTYWVMALARVLQGFAASVIWVVGLALV